MAATTVPLFLGKIQQAADISQRPPRSAECHRLGSFTFAVVGLAGKLGRKQAVLPSEC